jgi:hypothetical protein
MPPWVSGGSWCGGTDDPDRTPALECGAARGGIDEPDRPSTLECGRAVCVALQAARASANGRISSVGGRLDAADAICEEVCVMMEPVESASISARYSEVRTDGSGRYGVTQL